MASESLEFVVFMVHVSGRLEESGPSSENLEIFLARGGDSWQKLLSLRVKKEFIFNPADGGQENLGRQRNGGVDLTDCRFGAIFVVFANRRRYRNP